jgi:hypothetical protein
MEGVSRLGSMPGPTAYRDGFNPETTEALRVEVLALPGGPVMVTASMLAAALSLHLTPDEARRLALLLARAAVAARSAASTEEE